MKEVQLFNFGNAEIRTVLAEDGVIWFVAKDVADALGYSDSYSMTRRLDDDESMTAKLAGMNMNSTFINESGMYSAILGSTKQSAKEFKRWLTQSVLPTIRKTGKYDVSSDTWLKQRNADLNSKNIRLVEETTTVLKNVEQSTRKLATSAINLDCDLGTYRYLFKLHQEKEVKLNQSRRKAKQSLYNVMEGNIDFLLQQLAFRVEYDRSEEATTKLDALLAARYRAKQFAYYHNVETTELIDKLVTELHS